MSAEPWRRSGTLVAPWHFAWQAWYFGDLRLDLRGRCGILETFVSRCPRNLGDEPGPLWRRGFLRGRRGTLGTSGWICVAGVVLSRPL